MPDPILGCGNAVGPHHVQTKMLTDPSAFVAPQALFADLEHPEAAESVRIAYAQPHHLSLHHGSVTRAGKPGSIPEPPLPSASGC
mgnify:CR=1 FL=1